jgi:hypothetical protein
MTRQRSMRPTGRNRLVNLLRKLALHLGHGLCTHAALLRQDPGYVRLAARAGAALATQTRWRDLWSALAPAALALIAAARSTGRRRIGPPR